MDNAETVPASEFTRNFGPIHLVPAAKGFPYRNAHRSSI
jgi:hypothetical protein